MTFIGELHKSGLYGRVATRKSLLKESHTKFIEQFSTNHMKDAAEERKHSD